MEASSVNKKKPFFAGRRVKNRTRSRQFAGRIEIPAIMIERMPNTMRTMVSLSLTVVKKGLFPVF